MEKAYDLSQVKLSTVNEAIRSYVSKLDNNQMSAARVQELTYSNFFDNKLLVIHSIKQGISYELYHQIQSITPFTEEDWANYLNISTKTLQRNRKEAKFVFKPIHSEKILELVEVSLRGREVFDSGEQFYHWLQTPSVALGNQKPMDLLQDSYGKELIMEELNKIEYGIFA